MYDQLHDTIDRIQDKLTVSGMVDEFMGQAAMPKLEQGQDYVLGLPRRHPLPLMVAAAGIGFLIHRMNRRRASPLHVADDEVKVPALNLGQTRIYDSDHSPRHPLADGADARRIEA